MFSLRRQLTRLKHGCIHKAVSGQSALDTVKDLNGKPMGFDSSEQLIHERFF